VARSLRYALAHLATSHPHAAEHLRTSVRTGAYCSYQPDPYARVDWEL
jgi:non-specific serine/threonine protein kinase